MGVDLTVGDRVYVNSKGRVMTVEDIILPGDIHKEAMNWADVHNGGEFIVLKLTDSLTVNGNEVSIW